MKILVKKATLFTPGKGFSSRNQDVLLEDGKLIVNPDPKEAEKAKKTVEGEELVVSPGFVELSALSGDPGYEYREDLNTLTEAAAAGGFTAIGLLPNTEPVIQDKNDIHYVLRRAAEAVSEVLPYAAVTHDAKGEELTEMMDLHHAGAKGFTDGQEPIWNTDILMKALQYLKPFDGLLLNRPQDKWLSLFGQMHEGEVSTGLGMKGIPAVAEKVMIARDLDLLRYAGGRLHFSHVTTKEGLALIKAAKKEGLQVTCDVALYSLLFTDQATEDFDSVYKVMPPLRDASHQKALIKGVTDGTVDAISSAHVPVDEDNKKREFDLSLPGMAGIQTLLPGLIQLSKQIPLETLLEKVTKGPSAILKHENGEAWVVFDQKANWKLNAQSNRSKSKNSPWWEQTLTGKVIATVNGKKTFINEA